ncbi:MAG: leucine--tRNA ligase [Candidatus Altiarchaeota archaeon]|nr:leucine--tRNA ligase [Candidatus Altiarchaeota archaeon]
MASDFDPVAIQDKWTRKWVELNVFEARPDTSKEKFYLTVAFPYPSGSMHVGHGRTYTVPDVIARFKRMQGFNVLFPMAWHVTGSPVLGIAERIRKKDEQTLKLYGGLYRVPEKTLRDFTDPETIVKYFSSEYHRNMDGMGYSIDWTREFLSITPQYSRFIEWQYKKLHEKGLIKMGEHPVRYCPACNNPVGDHDLLQGENAEVNDFTVIKFRMQDVILPAATLRPETLFGVANMWVNPDVEYLKAKVDGETWIISREAAEKLAYLDKKVEETGKIKGEELVGKTCTDPLSGKGIPMLPATFVDPDYATGIVMSVPAHAPYDYMALKDLGSDIKSIVIIGEERYVPAEKIIKEMGITDQNDPKLEDATAQLYREEHAKGRMSKWIKDYGGLPVREAREKVIEDLTTKGDAENFYEFSENPVICRCGARCYIKILKDQWFIEYRDPGWKEKTHECLEGMRIVPRELKQNFTYFIDWLKDWACTRRVGLGTRFPYDDKWLIEPLSDSTIYMAFYTISRHVKKIGAEKLSPEFFDYVLLGEGDLNEVSEKTGIAGDEIEEARKEFLYWYPLDFRLSAKDLVGNHLSFFMFHHTAIFPKRNWPKGIAVFGMGLLEGNKMSSSKGNVVLLGDAIRDNGSDVVRLFLMGNAEPWQDFDWRENLVKNTSKKLRQYFDQITNAINLEGSMAERDIDRWLMGRLHEAIGKTTTALDGFQTRKALQSAFYDLMNDLLWYNRRCDPNPGTLKDFNREWIKLMAPFTPCTCEELWHKMGNNSFVSLEGYPAKDDNKIDAETGLKESLIKNLMEDIQHILDVSRITPKKIHVYLAPEWKRRLFWQMKGCTTIAEVMKDPEMKQHGKEVPQIMQKYRMEELPVKVFSLDEEYATLKEAAAFLEKEFKAEIDLQKTPSEDPDNKARYAMPHKPGLYIT